MGTDIKKVVVVTAGGSGMGAGAARKLAADGFHVAILSSIDTEDHTRRAPGRADLTNADACAVDVDDVGDVLLTHERPGIRGTRGVSSNVARRGSAQRHQGFGPCA